MSKFIEIAIGAFAFLSMCFTLICLLDIPAHVKKQKKPVYEFDTISSYDNVKYHVTVLEKLSHAYSVEIIRRVRMEWVAEDGVPLMIEVFWDEELYKEYLKGQITDDQ